METYVSSSVITDHTMNAIHGEPGFVAWHETYLEGLESYLSANGGAQFVPLPKWDPQTAIPPELVGIDPDCPDLCQPLVVTTPNMALPASMTCPQMCEDFPVYDEGCTDATSFSTILRCGLEQWHNSIHTAIGGTMATFNSPGALIFWLWHAFVDDVAWAYCNTCENQANTCGSAPPDPPSGNAFENDSLRGYLVEIGFYGIDNTELLHLYDSAYESYDDGRDYPAGIDGLERLGDRAREYKEEFHYFEYEIVSVKTYRSVEVLKAEYHDLKSYQASPTSSPSKAPTMKGKATTVEPTTVLPDYIPQPTKTAEETSKPTTLEGDRHVPKYVSTTPPSNRPTGIATREPTSVPTNGPSPVTTKRKETTDKPMSAYPAPEPTMTVEKTTKPTFIEGDRHTPKYAPTPSPTDRPTTTPVTERTNAPTNGPSPVTTKSKATTVKPTTAYPDPTPEPTRTVEDDRYIPKYVSTSPPSIRPTDVSTPEETTVPTNGPSPMTTKGKTKPVEPSTAYPAPEPTMTVKETSKPTSIEGDGHIPKYASTAPPSVHPAAAPMTEGTSVPTNGPSPVTTKSKTTTREPTADLPTYHPVFDLSSRPTSLSSKPR